MDSFVVEQFKEDRRKALLSLDLARVRAYMRKYGERPPDDDQMLLVSIHKARTGAKDLPQSARLHSKRWLTVRGYSSMDDGDLTPDQERGAPMR
jgi:hypothetical protein